MLVLYTQVYSQQTANVILLLLHVSSSNRMYSALYRLWLSKDGYDLQPKYIGSVKSIEKLVENRRVHYFKIWVDLRKSLLWLMRILSAGMWRHVVWQKFVKVSKIRVRFVLEKSTRAQGTSVPPLGFVPPMLHTHTSFVHERTRFWQRRYTKHFLLS